jgi:hypothetical protein
VSEANGYRPIRFQCQASGPCWNRMHRPKVEVFAECFPRGIGFSDADGLWIRRDADGWIVHLDRQYTRDRRDHYLWLEWKGIGAPQTTGQTLTGLALSRQQRWVVLGIEGDAATMAVRRYRYAEAGCWHPWIVGTLDDVKARMRDWVRRIEVASSLRRVGG